MPSLWDMVQKGSNKMLDRRAKHQAQQAKERIRARRASSGKKKPGIRRAVKFFPNRQSQLNAAIHHDSTGKRLR